MALTRARVLGGHAGVAAQLHELLAAPRDTAALRTDVLAMRAEMARAHPPGGVWDVKHGRGGLIDIEFVVHFVQLRDCAGLTPDLDAAIAGTRLPPSLAHANALQTRVLQSCKKDWNCRLSESGRLVTCAAMAHWCNTATQAAVRSMLLEQRECRRPPCYSCTCSSGHTAEEIS